MTQQVIRDPDGSISAVEIMIQIINVDHVEWSWASQIFRELSQEGRQYALSTSGFPDYCHHCRRKGHNILVLVVVDYFEPKN